MAKTPKKLKRNKSKSSQSKPKLKRTNSKSSLLSSTSSSVWIEDYTEGFRSNKKGSELWVEDDDSQFRLIQSQPSVSEKTKTVHKMRRTKSFKSPYSNAKRTPKKTKCSQNKCLLEKNIANLNSQPSNISKETTLSRYIEQNKQQEMFPKKITPTDTVELISAFISKANNHNDGLAQLMSSYKSPLRLTSPQVNSTYNKKHCVRNPTLSIISDMSILSLEDTPSPIYDFTFVTDINKCGETMEVNSLEFPITSQSASFSQDITELYLSGEKQMDNPNFVIGGNNKNTLEPNSLEFSCLSESTGFEHETSSIHNSLFLIGGNNRNTLEPNSLKFASLSQVFGENIGLDLEHETLPIDNSDFVIGGNNYSNNMVMNSNSQQKSAQTTTSIITRIDFNKQVSEFSYKFNEHNVDLTEAFTDNEEFLKKSNADIIKIQKSTNLRKFIETQNSLPADIEIEVVSDLKSGALSKSKTMKKIEKVLRNRELMYEGPPVKFISYEKNKQTTILKIEHTFNLIGEDIANGKKLAYVHQNYRNWNNTYMNNDKLTIKPIGEAKMTSICKYRKASLQKFEIMSYLLRKIYNMLMINATSSKREIYYLIKKYVKNQRQVDDAIDAVSCMLLIPIWHLNIFTTSRGLAYGKLKMTFTDNSTINFSTTGGTLIPQNITKLTRIESKAHFILIVEKDCIFQKLLDEGAPEKLFKPFILITGKGYADANTRLFIKTIWKLLSIPVFALMDADSHGIEIMCTYRFGSLASCYNAEDLAMPNIRWLGVLPSEISILDIKHTTLSAGEKKKINSLLQRPYIKSHPAIKEELELMKRRNIKAGIEGVIKSNNYLSKCYLPNKLIGRNFI